MDAFDRQVRTLVRAGVVIGEDGTIVCLDRPDAVRESSENIFQERDGMETRLVVVHTKIPPPGGAINGRVLKIPPTLYLAWDVLHINLHEFSWLQGNFDV